MSAEADALVATLASLVASPDYTQAPLNPSHCMQPPPLSSMSQRPRKQHPPPVQVLPTQRQQQQQQEQQQQQQQPLCNVKDALLFITEKLLQAEQQLQQDARARQPTQLLAGLAGHVQQLHPQEGGQQLQQQQQQQQLQQKQHQQQLLQQHHPQQHLQQQLQQQLEQQLQQQLPNPLHAAAINAQELGRMHKQQQVLVSFLQKRLQLEQQQMLQQQLQLQQQQKQQQRTDVAAHLTRSDKDSGSRSKQRSNGNAQESHSNHTSSSSSSREAGAAAAASSGHELGPPQVQGADSTVQHMVKVARLMPKVEGVCFDKFFKRWVAKKSGTKKVYFPVHKYGFDRAYCLAVETRKAHLQSAKTALATEKPEDGLPADFEVHPAEAAEVEGGLRGPLLTRASSEQQLGGLALNAASETLCRKAGSPSRGPAGLPQVVVGEVRAALSYTAWTLLNY
ncbi:hypothetical protein Esti_000145 [Eimeria stiedai]